MIKHLHCWINDVSSGVSHIIIIIIIMGPKKKGKTGAGSPTQGEEAKVGEKISEVDKEWYGIQIKSLEEKLDRRNEKLR